MIIATTFVQGIRKGTVALNELLIMITDKSWPIKNYLSYSQPGLCEKCPYSEFFRSVFSSLWTEYGEILCISLHSVRMRKNTGQKNSKYGHFSRSVGLVMKSFSIKNLTRLNESVFPWKHLNHNTNSPPQ